jgi:hypothetical protein
MHTQNVDYEIVSSGIDWLTFTMKPQNVDLSLVKAVWDKEMDTQLQMGFESTTCGIKGYSGPGCGAFGYGDRAMDSVFRVSGDAADTMAVHLLKMGVKFNPTRVDLQVTLQFKTETKGFAADIRHRIRLQESFNDSETSARLDLKEGGKQGDSIDINSRRSRSFLRNYDKTKEQKGRIAENCIRFEQENKRERARAVWAYFKSSRSSWALAVEQVSTALKRKGVIMEWNYDVPRVKLPTERHQTDDERRAKWAVEFVAPVVRGIKDESLRQRIAHAMGFVIDNDANDRSDKVFGPDLP